jgi:hypothetical protein
MNCAMGCLGEIHGLAVTHAAQQLWLVLTAVRQPQHALQQLNSLLCCTDLPLTMCAVMPLCCTMEEPWLVADVGRLPLC